MTESSTVCKVGTRGSKLSLIQTRAALKELETLLPGMRFEKQPFSSPGDRDRKTDLRRSPGDFFTRDLDQAVLDGETRFAVHSAKDLAYPVREGIDWVWLPNPADRRDALVLAAGQKAPDLPERPRMGVSSERRAEYVRRRWPDAELKPVRGNVESRVAQVDAGDFDAIVIAACALVRLGMPERITEWIPLEELDTPDAQGALAMAFRADDLPALRLRSLLVKAVTFVGAGSGGVGACTLAGLEAVRQCDVCLYDALMDYDLLSELPGGARAIDVGKRAGDHAKEQREINLLLADLARKGRRVVRLKGGDPGIFGRLTEEVDTLDSYRLPYRVIPGLSSLMPATTGTGMLLTKRDGSKGFTVMTPRKRGGGLAPVTGEARAELPVVYFMSVGCSAQVAAEMIADGTPAETPVAFVFSAGSPEQRVVRGRLDEVDGLVPLEAKGRPGLFIVGEIAEDHYHDWGALRGARVLLTCSDALQPHAGRLVFDFGGVPVRRPLIQLVPRDDARDILARMGDFDWVVVTSPSAVRCLWDLLPKSGLDVRNMPRVMSCGPGTSREFRTRGIHPDAQPESGFGGAGLIEIAGGAMRRGMRILRLRSDKAGPALADALAEQGMDVTDCVLYDTMRFAGEETPRFEAVFFASSSAVKSFVAQWGAAAAAGAITCAMGQPTKKTMDEAGIHVDTMGVQATAEAAIRALAGYYVNRDLEDMK